MQWLADSVSALFVGGGQPEPEATQNAAAPQSNVAPAACAKPLQTTGMLTKGQLLRFFDAGRQQLNDPDVKMRLKDAHEAKEDVEDIITELQKELFEQQGIEGDWGLKCLGRINTEHRGDTDFMAAFYEFVMREEAAVDEAVMPADAFKQKQEMMGRLQRQQEELQKRTAGLPPEKRQYFLQQQQLVIANMQAQQAGMAEKMQGMSQEERADFITQQMDRMQHALEQAAQGVPDATDTAMSEQEQTGFLQQLSKSGKAA